MPADITAPVLRVVQQSFRSPWPAHWPDRRGVVGLHAKTFKFYQGKAKADLKGIWGRVRRASGGGF